MSPSAPAPRSAVAGAQTLCPLDWDTQQPCLGCAPFQELVLVEEGAGREASLSRNVLTGGSSAQRAALSRSAAKQKPAWGLAPVSLLLGPRVPLRDRVPPQGFGLQPPQRTKELKDY